MAAHPRNLPQPFNGAMDNSIAAHGSRQPSVENETPSYWVEHLVTFAVSRDFGLQYPEDGIRKLKQLEMNSAIWAQPMVLRLRPNVVSVEDENGDLVEQFPMDLVTNPTAQLSTNPRDVYNNILLFIVKEDKKHGRNLNPTEMHIFQCNRVSANDVVEDMKAYLSGRYQRVRAGRRDTGFVIGYQPPVMTGPAPRGYRDDASASSDSSESFERDVNTLNRCFDDIERFVARIQSAAVAQRELEAQAHRQRTTHRKRGSAQGPSDLQNGILLMRAQPPAEFEFVDIFQKFKLSFNLLAKLKNHIHEPNAPELLHFLFTPLTIILDACHWGLGRNIAPQVVSPLLSRETRELMQNCLTSKESDVWMALGEAWRIPPEDWVGPLPKPFRPVFLDGFAPYGPPDSNDGPQYRYPPAPQPVHRGVSAPPPPTQNSYPQRLPIRDRSVDNLNVDLDRMSLERERLDIERERIAERERQLMEEKRKIIQERQRLAAERELIAQEAEQRSMGSVYTARLNDSSRQPSPAFSRHLPEFTPSQLNGGEQRIVPAAGSLPPPDQSPRQRAFLDDVIARRGKLVQVTYDRVAQNAKELTVSSGEYLEVLNDSKNWWECINVHHRNGYVPHTILTVLNVERSSSPHSLSPQDPSLHFIDRTRSQQNSSPSNRAAPSLSPRPGMMVDDTPDYIKQRQGEDSSNDHGSSPLQNNASETSEQPGQARPVVFPPKASDTASEASLTIKSEQASSSVEDAKNEVSDNPPARKGIVVLHSPPREHINEILQTIGTEKGEHILTKNRPHTGERLQISERSSPEDVRAWLTDKGFSVRVQYLLADISGPYLFSLTRPKLVEACGREEGSRLYSQILLQKQKSKYETPSRHELEEILRYQKMRVDAANEIPVDKPVNQHAVKSTSPAGNLQKAR